MPEFRSRSVIEVARGLKAFLELHAGLVRNEAPDSNGEAGAEHRELHRALRQAHERTERQTRELERMRERLSKIERRKRDENREPSYEELYEARIRATSPDVTIGTGRVPFDIIGGVELEVLQKEGLGPTDTLVDLGCGSGRLAVHAIPALAGGHYVGIDISRTMLDAARERIEQKIPSPACNILWLHQTSPVLRWRRTAST